MLDGYPRPFIFAHRGASAYAPENTLAAFELAVRLGSPAIELDAKLSADRKVIVIHDPTLDRTTGVHGRVSQFSLARLQELDAGSFFAPEFKGEKIPTLESVFEAVGKRLFINVELTNYTTSGDGLADEVAALVKRMDMAGRVFFSSFNPSNLIRARRFLPQVPLGLLALEGRPGAIARSFLGRLVPHEAIHPYWTDVNAAFVQSEHKRGKKVFVWTVNDPLKMHFLFEVGVDGIFTDDPILALQAAAEIERS